MSEKINNKFTENNNHNDSIIKRIEAIKPNFNAGGIGLKVSSYPAQGYERTDYKFDHIVIRSCASAEFDYDLFEALDLIDITYVTDYPEGHIAFIDASKKLPDEFFYYLVERARTLLIIVNTNYTKYDKIEDCAAYRDLMTTLIFIRKYSDKFNYYTYTSFILVRRHDVPGVYLEMVTVYDVPDIAAPKPISIYNNPRYKDYGKYESAKDAENKFAGAFVADHNIKPKEIIKDIDISTLYPTKQNPMYSECWKYNLELYINQFNALIKDGMTLDEAWKSDPGTSLKCLIDCLLNFDCELICKYKIDFAIVVGEDNQLKLGKSSDLESMKSNIENEKDDDNDSYLASPGDLVRVGKEYDKRSICNDKIAEVFSHISLKDLIIVVENNQIPTEYIGYLKRMIDIFNRQIENGDIEKVWNDRKIGRLLKTFINNLAEAAGESDDYDINFSITVTDTGHLKLGRFADVEEKFNTYRLLSKPNDSVSICYEHESSDEETDDEVTEEPAATVISYDKSTAALLDKMTDEQIANSYEDILKFFISGFNKFIDEGIDIKEAWKTNVGKDLVSFINYIFDLSTKDKFGKSINFAIIVDDDYKLRLGKYSDIETADAGLGLTSPGNFIRSTHTEDEEEDTDSDQQQ